jgi:hypothetical protein
MNIISLYAVFITILILFPILTGFLYCTMKDYYRDWLENHVKED